MPFQISHPLLNTQDLVVSPTISHQGLMYQENIFRPVLHQQVLANSSQPDIGLAWTELKPPDGIFDIIIPDQHIEDEPDDLSISGLDQ